MLSIWWKVLSLDPQNCCKKHGVLKSKWGWMNENWVRRNIAKKSVVHFPSLWKHQTPLLVYPITSFQGWFASRYRRTYSGPFHFLECAYRSGECVLQFVGYNIQTSWFKKCFFMKESWTMSLLYSFKFRLLFFSQVAKPTVLAHWFPLGNHRTTLGRSIKVLPQIGIPVHLLKPCGQAAKASTGTDDSVGVAFVCLCGFKG